MNFFSATFVQNGAIFWVGVESDPVEVVKRSLPDDSFRGGISTMKTPKRLTTVPNYTLKPESKVGTFDNQLSRFAFFYVILSWLLLFFTE